MSDPHPLPGADHVVDGIRIHVTSHGAEPAGRLPVLLLHGLPTSAYLWRDVMRDLGRQRRTLAPDLVGLGRSERPQRGGYDLGSQARRLWQLLDSVGIDRVAVVGHDLGGALAAHLTALAPERVGALGLVDAVVHADVFPTPPVRPLLLRGLGEAYVAALRRAPEVARGVLARALLDRVAADGAPDTGVAPLTPRELEGYLAPLLTADGARGLLRFVRAVDMVATEAAFDLVAAAPPPALVLWGELDPLLPLDYGRRLAGLLPDATFVPLAGAGHLLPQERPERVAEELAGFLAEVPV